MHVMFFQYGDYAYAYKRFKSGEPETYRDQKFSVEFVESLSASDAVTTVAISDDTHDEQLAPTLRSIGLAREALTFSKISAIFDDVKPDYVVCRTFFNGIIAEAIKRKIPVLPSVAHIFRNDQVKKTLAHIRLRLLLARGNVPAIANHSLNASLSMAEALHFPREKIVPWDWRRVECVDTPKSVSADKKRWRGFFAGAVNELKGVGDCIDAVKLVRERGHDFSMTFAGPGALDDWCAYAHARGVDEHVTFLGVIPNTDVAIQMNAHDIVIVPSRHGFAEGLPNTIYEGLAARSPLVISDHPAFKGRLEAGRACLDFEGSNPQSLADALERLVTDHELYAQLSKEAPDALEKLYVGLPWNELIAHFLKDPANKTGWVQENSLAALGY